jgi:hypothetical protein
MDWQQFNLEIWVFKSSLELTLMVFYDFLRLFEEHCELCFIRICVKLSCSQLLEKTLRHLLLYVDIVFIFKFLVSVLHSCRHYCQSTFSSLGRDCVGSLRNGHPLLQLILTSYLFVSLGKVVLG